MKKAWIILFSLLVMMFSVANAETKIETPLVIWLEGKEYEMPCKVFALENDGWSLYRYAIGENYYSPVDTTQKIPSEWLEDEFRMLKNGKEISVILKNEDLGEVACKWYSVVAVMVKHFFDKPAELSYEGLRYGRTNKANLPAWAKNSADGGFLHVDDNNYGDDYSYSIDAFWDKNEPIKVMAIYAEHKNTIYRPEYFDQYVEPVKLNKDWKSGVVLLDGKLYQLPAPIEQFVADGWIVADNWVAPGCKIDRQMTKGEKSAQISAHNIMTDQGTKEGKKTSAIFCEADGVTAFEGTYMRVGYFETGMTESELKMKSIIHAGGKLISTDTTYKNGSRIETYELESYTKLPSSWKRPDGNNHKNYRLWFYVTDGIVTGIKASY